MSQVPRRLACLYAAELALQAVLRAEPELSTQPLGVVDGPALSGRALVLAVTPAAKALGVRAGMSVAQATATAGTLVCRVRTEAALRSAREALGDVARTFGARVEHAAADTVYLEVGDLRRLFPRETNLCAAFDAAARKVGLCIRVGLAGTKAAARLAARQSEDGAATLVPPGGEAAFLARLPVALADPAPELAAALQRFGLPTLGAVAALPGEGFGRRLGREGAAFWRLARGEDNAPLVAERETEIFSESLELDYSLDSTEPLGFLFSGALSRLCARLSLRGLACAGLSMQLELSSRSVVSSSGVASSSGAASSSVAPGAEGVGTVGAGASAVGSKSWVRDVPIAAPTLEVPVLVTLLRLSLEAAPPPGPVCGFRLLATPGLAPNAQLSLFEPVLPAPARLAATVAKLAALCGAERVGAPVVVDSLRPEAEGVALFAPKPRSEQVPTRRGARAPRATQEAQFLQSNSKLQMTQKPYKHDSGLIEKFNRKAQDLHSAQGPGGASAHAAEDGHGAAHEHSPEAPARVLCLRRVHPPRPVEVRLWRERPVSIDDERLVHATGPWRVLGEWWSDGPFARDYYDAESLRGVLYRLYRDAGGEGWFIDAFYD